MVLIVLSSMAISGAGGYFGRRYLEKIKRSSAEEISEKIIKDAQEEAQILKKEALLEARDELHKEKGSLKKRYGTDEVN